MPKLAKRGRFTSGGRKGDDATFKQNVNGLAGLIDKAEVVTLKENAELESNKVPQKRHYIGNLFQPSHEAKNIISSTPHYTKTSQSQRFFGKNFSIFLSPIGVAENDENYKKNPVQKVILQKNENSLNKVSSNKNDDLKSDDRLIENDQSQQIIRKSLRISNKYLDNLNRSNIEDKLSFKSNNYIIKSSDKSFAQATKNVARSPIKETEKTTESSVKLDSVKERVTKSAISPVKLPHKKPTEKDLSRTRSGESSSAQKAAAIKTRIPVRTVSQERIKTLEGNNLQANLNKPLNKHDTKATTSKRNTSLSPNRNKKTNTEIRNCPSGKPPEKTPMKDDSKELENLKPNNSCERENYVINISSSDSLANFEENYNNDDNEDSADSDYSSDEPVHDRMQFVNNTSRPRNISTKSPGKGQDRRPEVTREEPPNVSIGDSEKTLTNTYLNETEKRNQNNLLAKVSARKTVVDKNVQTSITKEENAPVEKPMDKPKEAQSDWNTIMAEIKSKKDPTNKNENETSRNTRRKPLVVAHRKQPCIQLGTPPHTSDSFDQFALNHLIDNKESAGDGNKTRLAEQNNVENWNKMSEEDKREYESIMADILADDDENQTSINDNPAPPVHSGEVPPKVTAVDREIQTSIIKKYQKNVEKLKDPPKEPESKRNGIMTGLLARDTNDETRTSTRASNRKKQKPKRFTSVDQFSTLEEVGNGNTLKSAKHTTDVKKPKATPKEDESGIVAETKKTASSNGNEKSENEILRVLARTRLSVLLENPQAESQARGLSMDSFDRYALMRLLDRIGAVGDVPRETVGDKKNQASKKNVEKPSEEDQSVQNTVMTDNLATNDESETSIPEKNQHSRRLACPGKVSTRGSVLERNIQRSTMTEHNTKYKILKAKPREDESNWSNVLAEIATKKKRPYKENRDSLFYNRKLFVRSKRQKKYILIEEYAKPNELERPTSQEITNVDDEGSRDPFSDVGSSGAGSNVVEDGFNFVNDDAPMWDVYGDDGDQIESSDGTSNKPLRLLARVGSDPTRKRHSLRRSCLPNQKNLDSSNFSFLGPNNSTTQGQTAHNLGEADSSKKHLKTRASTSNRKDSNTFPPVQEAEEMVPTAHRSLRKRTRKYNKNNSSAEDGSSNNDNTIIPVSSSDQELLGVRPLEKINVVADIHNGANNFPSSSGNKTSKEQKIKSAGMLSKDNNQHLNAIEVGTDSEISCPSSFLHRNKNTLKLRKRKSSEISYEDFNSANLDAIEVPANSDVWNLPVSPGIPKRQKRISTRKCTDDGKSSEISNKDNAIQSSPGIHKRQKRVSSKGRTEDNKSSKRDNNQHPNSESVNDIQKMANSEESNHCPTPKRQKRVSSKRGTKEHLKEKDVSKENSRNKKPQLKNGRESAINPSNILTGTDGQRPQRNRKPVRLLVDIVVDEATLMKWSEEIEKKEKASRLRKQKLAKLQKPLTPQPGKSNRTTGKRSENDPHTKTRGKSDRTVSGTENKPNKRSKTKKAEKFPSSMPNEKSVENIDIASDELMQPPSQEQGNGSPETPLEPENYQGNRRGRSRKADKGPKTSSRMPKKNILENMDNAFDEMMQPAIIQEKLDGLPERQLEPEKSRSRNRGSRTRKTDNVPKSRSRNRGSRTRKTDNVPKSRSRNRGSRTRKTDNVPKSPSPMQKENSVANLDIAFDELMQPPTSREQVNESPERYLDPSPPLCHKQVDEPMDNERMSLRNGTKKFCTLTSDSGVDTLHTMDNTNKRDLTCSSRQKQTMSKTNTNDEQLPPDEEKLPSISEQSFSRLEFDPGQETNKNVAETELDPWQKEGSDSRQFEHSASSWQNAENRRDSSVLSVSSTQNEHLNYVLNGKPVSFKFAGNTPAKTEFSKIGNLYVTQSSSLKNIFSAGYILLQPGDRKQTTLATKYSFMYTVVKGQAWVRCYNRTSIIHQGGYFFIPVGTEYSIRNVNKHGELLMSYMKVPVHRRRMATSAGIRKRSLNSDISDYY